MRGFWDSLQKVSDEVRHKHALRGVRREMCEACHGRGREEAWEDWDCHGPISFPGAVCEECVGMGFLELEISAKAHRKAIDDEITSLRKRRAAIK